jgi:hypothetical protein
MVAVLLEMERALQEGYHKNGNYNFGRTRKVYDYRILVSYQNKSKTFLFY